MLKSITIILLFVTTIKPEKLDGSEVEIKITPFAYSKNRELTIIVLPQQRWRSFEEAKQRCKGLEHKKKFHLAYEMEEENVAEEVWKRMINSDFTKFSRRKSKLQKP